MRKLLDLNWSFNTIMLTIIYQMFIAIVYLLVSSCIVTYKLNLDLKR